MNIPEPGYYYHYKHDTTKGVNNYAYEVLGVAMHTEDGSKTVIYRPLYKNISLNDAQFYARPLDMFIENVQKEGKTVPRFTKITDESVIDELKKY